MKANKSETKASGVKANKSNTREVGQQVTERPDVLNGS
jgi:hypothetical protein